MPLSSLPLWFPTARRIPLEIPPATVTGSWPTSWFAITPIFHFTSASAATFQFLPALGPPAFILEWSLRCLSSPPSFVQLKFFLKGSALVSLTREILGIFPIDISSPWKLRLLCFRHQKLMEPERLKLILPQAQWVNTQMSSEMGLASSLHLAFFSILFSLFTYFVVDDAVF